MCAAGQFAREIMGAVIELLDLGKSSTADISLHSTVDVRIRVKFRTVRRQENSSMRSLSSEVHCITILLLYTGRLSTNKKIFCSSSSIRFAMKAIKDFWFKGLHCTLNRKSSWFEMARTIVAAFQRSSSQSNIGICQPANTKSPHWCRASQPFRLPSRWWHFGLGSRSDWGILFELVKRPLYGPKIELPHPGCWRKYFQMLRKKSLTPLCWTKEGQKSWSSQTKERRTDAWYFYAATYNDEAGEGKSEKEDEPILF